VPASLPIGLFIWLSYSASISDNCMLSLVKVIENIFFSPALSSVRAVE